MLKFYNSLSNTKEEFKPIDCNHIKMYVCGPTVYDDIHIGNARPIVVFDSIFRLLNVLYTKVSYARNITDIDDKIIVRAKENNESIANLTHRVTASYHNEIAKLNCLIPTFEPKATDNIKEMQEIITKLLGCNFAYAAAGHVFFAVDKYKDYGRLSGMGLQEIIAGARVEVNELKQNPADFVLWKPSKDGEVGYPSPWFEGLGRPGWHIECSAMAMRYLGNEIDIHGGGKDLLFPHHENERAQSVCSSNSVNFANYWLHNGYLMVEGKKMSKSLGNFLTLKEVNQKHDGEVIRLALLMTHYRQPLDFKQDLLEQAKSILEKFYTILLDSKDKFNNFSSIIEKNIPSKVRYNSNFMAALKDDFNTPKALSILHELFKNLESLQKQGINSKDDNLKEWYLLYNDIINSANILGILLQNPQEWIEKNNNSNTDRACNLSESEILDLITKRDAAKEAKNYVLADAIRAQLSNNNIILVDTVNGTIWNKK